MLHVSLSKQDQKSALTKTNLTSLKHSCSFLNVKCKKIIYSFSVIFVELYCLSTLLAVLLTLVTYFLQCVTPRSAVPLFQNALIITPQLL